MEDLQYTEDPVQAKALWPVLVQAVTRSFPYLENLTPKLQTPTTTSQAKASKQQATETNTHHLKEEILSSWETTTMMTSTRQLES